MNELNLKREVTSHPQSSSLHITDTHPNTEIGEIQKYDIIEPAHSTANLSLVESELNNHMLRKRNASMNK